MPVCKAMATFQGMDFWNKKWRCRNCWIMLIIFSLTLLSSLALLEFLLLPLCFSNSTSHSLQSLKSSPINPPTASQLPTTSKNHLHPNSKCASALGPNPDPAASTPKPVKITAPPPNPDLAIAPTPSPSTPPTRKSERASSKD